MIFPGCAGIGSGLHREDKLGSADPSRRQASAAYKWVKVFQTRRQWPRVADPSAERHGRDKDRPFARIR